MVLVVVGVIIDEEKKGGEECSKHPPFIFSRSQPSTLSHTGHRLKISLEAPQQVINNHIRSYDIIYYSISLISFDTMRYHSNMTNQLVV